MRLRRNSNPDEQTTLMRDLLRDPLHVPELMLLHAQAKLAPGATAWSESAAAAPPESVRKAQRQAFTAARIDGAISGTPFLIALIPAYIAALWEQARLALRMAALSGRDPASADTAAELLVLRGVHPDMETAARELEAARSRSREPLPEGHRNKAREFYSLGIRVLMFAAFIAPPKDEKPSLPRRVIGFIGAGSLWVITWIVPLAFMALMAWSCESSTRRMAELTIGGWLPNLEPPEPEPIGQRIVRALVILVIGVLPLTIIALGVLDPTKGLLAFVGLLGVMVAFSMAFIVSRDGKLISDR